MKKALKIIGNVLLWVLLIFALLITILVFSSNSNNGVSSLFGLMPMTVESDSMKPTFKENDMIMVKEIDDINDLKVDDVITFWTRSIVEGQRVKNTHRIVEIKETSSGSRTFITRGDNNPADDEVPVYAADIIGKWTGFKLPGFGKVMHFLQTKTGFFLCIVLPMALFFLFELYRFITTLIEVKKADTITETDEEEIKRRAIEEYLASQKQAAEAAGAGETKTEAPEAPAQETPAENAEAETTEDNTSAADPAPDGEKTEE